MKTFWLPLLSAGLLCAGIGHTERITTNSSNRPDAGPEVPPSEDAGTTISFPDPTEMRQGDVSLDGSAFKAIRVAMEDLKPRNRPLPTDKMEACFDDESAYDLQEARQSLLHQNRDDP